MDNLDDSTVDPAVPSPSSSSAATPCAPPPDAATAAAAEPLAPLPLRNRYHRHVARSAAKRQSVQLLGSIRDLQLQFSRSGLDSEHLAGAGSRLGLGLKASSPLSANSLCGVRENPQGFRSAPIDIENRPPQTTRAGEAAAGALEQRQRKPWKEVELVRVGITEAKTEARALIMDVRNHWMASSAMLTTASSDSLTVSSELSKFRIDAIDSNDYPVRDCINYPDTRSLLVNTARAVRRVRTLALSFAATPGQRRVSAPVSRLGAISTPSRPGGISVRAVSYALPERSKASSSILNGAPINPGAADPLAPVRKAALDVLGHLRSLEEKLRVVNVSDVPIVIPHVVAEADVMETPGQLDVSAVEIRPSSSLESELVSMIVGSNDTTITDEAGDGIGFDDYSDEEFRVNLIAQDAEDERASLQPWEDRLVAEAREYVDFSNVQDVEMVNAAREAVFRWTEMVERAFDKRTGDDDGLPNASETRNRGACEDEKWIGGNWHGKQLDRATEFIAVYLPRDLARLLPTDSGSLLLRLSARDGYMLAIALNSYLATSSRPWGFILHEDLHDTLSVAGTPSLAQLQFSEDAVDERGKEWTFRRVGNLTCWAGALRLRFGLPIHIPNATTAGTEVRGSSTVRCREGTRIEFDPLVVAKREDRWEIMLSTVLEAWIEAAAKETREAHSS